MPPGYFVMWCKVVVYKASLMKNMGTNNQSINANHTVDTPSYTSERVRISIPSFWSANNSHSMRSDQ